MTEPRVRFCAPNAIRISQAPSPDPVWIRDILIQPEISEEQCKLRAETAGGCIRIKNVQGEMILQVVRTISSAPEKLRLILHIEPREGFYGWGEWFNAFRRDRGQVMLKNRDAIALLQGRFTYSGIPFFLSSRGYGFLLLNGHATRWEIDPHQGILAIEAAGPPMDYIVINGPSFKEILKTYTYLTGRPPLLPKWAFGLWVTSYPQEHQDAVISLVQAHKEHAIPLDAVILDYHWEERFHNFKWRQELIPEPDRLISQLKKQGVHLGLIFTPFVNKENGYLLKMLLQALVQDIPPGMVFADDRALPEYKAARAKAYLAHDKVSWWFGKGGMIDFTNPEACAWWNGMLRPLYDQGVSFFKNDDGEYLPEDARNSRGMEGREFHNLYGFYYGKAIYEGMTVLDERRPMIYARSVWAGSQRYPALFLGDQKPTFECIKRTMRAGLNLGLAGFAYWTADVFGLDGKTTPETHMRYAQWALLVPIARYFVRPARIDATRFPWSHSQAAEANFRKYVELRYALLPYYLALAWESWQTGLPIMRPLVLEFQHDQRVADIFDQVMLGDRLMLAPIVETGAASRRVVLPEGIWHDFWSGQSWQGPAEITYPAPLDKLPILVRGGAVIPLGPVMQHIPDDHQLDELTLHFWPPYPTDPLDRNATVDYALGSITLYEDDGQTIAYQSGGFSTFTIDTTQDINRLTIAIAPASGRFPWQPQTRAIECILHRSEQPHEVMVNGNPIAATYDQVSKETRIRLQCPTHDMTLITIIH